MLVSRRKLTLEATASKADGDLARSLRESGHPLRSSAPPSCRRRTPFPRPPSRRWARQPFLRTDHPHLNLDLLALGHAQVFIEFDGLAVDFSVQCFGHGGFLLIVRRGFGPLSLGFGLFISTRVDAD